MDNKQLSLAEMKRVFEQREKALKALLDKRSEIMNALSKIDSQIETESGMSVQAVLEEFSNGQISDEDAVRVVEQDIARLTNKHRERTVKNTGDKALSAYILDILKENKEGLRPTEITPLVLEAGYKTKATNFNANVNQALHKMKKQGEVEQRGGGRYFAKTI